MPKTPRGVAILDCYMDHDDNDAGVSSVRAYLRELLIALIEEGEGFSGKRPLGNSDWQFQLANALVRAGLMDGEVVDEHSCEFEWDDFNNAMTTGIHAL